MQLQSINPEKLNTTQRNRLFPPLLAKFFSIGTTGRMAVLGPQGHWGLAGREQNLRKAHLPLPSPRDYQELLELEPTWTSSALSLANLIQSMRTESFSLSEGKARHIQLGKLNLVGLHFYIPLPPSLLISILITSPLLRIFMIIGANEYDSPPPPPPWERFQRSVASNFSG